MIMHYHYSNLTQRTKRWEDKYLPKETLQRAASNPSSLTAASALSCRTASIHRRSLLLCTHCHLYQVPHSRGFHQVRSSHRFRHPAQTLPPIPIFDLLNSPGLGPSGNRTRDNSASQHSCFQMVPCPLLCYT